MHGLEIYVNKGFPFAQELSLENSADFIYVFEWLCFIQHLTSFFYMDHYMSTI